ncbi:GSCOCG00000271001-RA-CDS [Cotesia congregata]|nr:GSCOCG00000271001-RA-CDS [Cotesia congregata]
MLFLRLSGGTRASQSFAIDSCSSIGRGGGLVYVPEKLQAWTQDQASEAQG